jgi:hypothetical protein
MFPIWANPAQLILWKHHLRLPPPRSALHFPHFRPPPDRTPPVPPRSADNTPHPPPAPRHPARPPPRIAPFSRRSAADSPAAPPAPRNTPAPRAAPTTPRSSAEVRNPGPSASTPPGRPIAASCPSAAPAPRPSSRSRTTQASPRPPPRRPIHPLLSKRPIRACPSRYPPTRPGASRSSRQTPRSVTSRQSQRDWLPEPGIGTRSTPTPGRGGAAGDPSGQATNPGRFRSSGGPWRWNTGDH